jgi:predicted Zn-dependent peptidase
MLETVLWAEADRMQGLKVTQAELTNQQDVVANEIKLQVINQPYGQFFYWLEMPQYAYENWSNSHSFYGDLDDIAAATLEEVHRFYDTYYAPNNAALVVVGDLDSEEALTWVKKYFGHLPVKEVPALPDMSEPRQRKEKRINRTDKLANRPALAFAYHVPERFTPEYFAFGLLDQILLQGEDSRLYQALVKKNGMAGSLKGGINVMGNMFSYNDPTLWTVYLFHDSTVPADAILKVVDEEIERLCITPVEQAELEHMLVKFRSAFYERIGRSLGLSLAELLACFALFDDEPDRINSIMENLKQVTPRLILETAREYLRATNRTILIIEPEPKGQVGGE